ncbi:F-box/LRR-repeat protein [Apostasia shenzhenica]|uniref:F-box/LRR-repeat protein n=1 Tax=Apostasia shenzhenica TaxID=1088818 RepID=A0A2I0BDX8_9ASPA|nr:F-box/LRR-repeat protein [Apostasia shenzhenica]
MESERRWEELPLDCLVQIFCKLGMEDLALFAPFVCKSWHRACLDPQCWKNLDFRELDFSAGSRFVGDFKRLYGVHSFSFSAFMKLCLARSHGSAVELAIPFILGASLQEDLISASIECPRLKVLALPSLLLKDEKKLPELMRKWKELQILELTWKQFSFPEIMEAIKTNCPNFVGLHLCGFFTAAEAHAIARCAPKLKILVVSASFLRREDLMVILDGCRELEVVDVSGCGGFAAANDREILNKAAGIKRFECGGCVEEEDNISYVHNYYDYEDVFMGLGCC